MKIRLVMLGKTRREEAKALVEDFANRIKHYVEFEILELRDSGPAALRKLKIDPAATVVLLDAAGKHAREAQKIWTARIATHDWSKIRDENPPADAG